jgi:hypothetical protein
MDLETYQGYKIFSGMVKFFDSVPGMWSSNMSQYMGKTIYIVKVSDGYVQVADFNGRETEHYKYRVDEVILRPEEEVPNEHPF